MTEPQVPVSLSEMKTILFLVRIPQGMYEGNRDRYSRLYGELKARVLDAEMWYAGLSAAERTNFFRECEEHQERFPGLYPPPLTQESRDDGLPDVAG
jgi:hypothetical protein